MTALPGEQRYSPASGRKGQPKQNVLETIFHLSFSISLFFGIRHPSRVTHRSDHAMANEK